VKIIFRFILIGSGLLLLALIFFIGNAFYSFIPTTVDLTQDSWEFQKECGFVPQNKKVYVGGVGTNYWAVRVSPGEFERIKSERNLSQIKRDDFYRPHSPLWWRPPSSALTYTAQVYWGNEINPHIYYYLYDPSRGWLYIETWV